KTNAICPRQTLQVKRGELRARETIRRDIRREHAARSINCNNDIQSALPRLLVREAPLWSRQDEHEQATCNNEHSHPNLLTTGRDSNREMRQETRLHEFGDQLPPLTPGPPEECHERHQE